MPQQAQRRLVGSGLVAGGRAARATVTNALAVLLGAWLDDRGPLAARREPIAEATSKANRGPLPRLARRTFARTRLGLIVAALATIVGISPVPVRGAPEEEVGRAASQAAGRPRVSSSGPTAVGPRSGRPSSSDRRSDATTSGVPLSRLQPATARAGTRAATTGRRPAALTGEMPVAVIRRAAAEPLDTAGTLIRPLTVDRTAAAPRPGVTRYRTVEGDWALLIAERYGVNFMTLWWANRFREADFLKQDHIIRVLPVKGTFHKVREGDTLDRIARIHRADVAEIAAFNRLKGGVPLIGQRLIIPGGKGPKYQEFEEEPELSPVAARLRVYDDETLRAGPAHVVRPPVVIPQSTLEHKLTGGVGWPLDPGATALTGGWTWEIFDDGTGRTDGPRFPRAYVDPEKKSHRAGTRGGGAGAMHGGGTQVQGPPPGPPQGVVLDIEDPRLRLTAEQALRERALQWPVKRRGYLSQPFHYKTGDWEADHLAIDIGAPLGTPLVAAADGRVMFSGWRDDRSGNAVWLKHGPGLFTAYAHMLSVSVELGQYVRRGEVIGRLGSTGNSTGPHVHFSVSVGGDRPDIAAYRVDPMPFLAPR